MLTLTCCQDHILTENIWFVWSKTSNCGNECYRCGTNNKQTLKIELLSQWKLEAEFRNIVHNEFSIKFVELCHHDRKKTIIKQRKAKWQNIPACKTNNSFSKELLCIALCPRKTFSNHISDTRAYLYNFYFQFVWLNPNSKLLWRQMIGYGHWQTMDPCQGDGNKYQVLLSYHQPADDII